MNNIPLITLVISGLGIFVPLIAVFMQIRQNNAALGATILRELEKDFLWSEEMRSKRLATATFLLNRKKTDTPDMQTANVLDFFDSVGIYYRKHIIDTEMTWGMFYYWLGAYWQLLKADASYIEDHEGGIEYYRNVRYLYSALTLYGRIWRHLPKEEEHFTESMLHTFLEDEIRQCTPIKQEASSSLSGEIAARGKSSPLLSFNIAGKSIRVYVADEPIDR